MGHAIPHGDHGDIPGSVCQCTHRGSCAVLLHGLECVWAYLWVKAKRIWLLTMCFSSALSFSVLFPLVLNYSHHDRFLPPSVGCYVVLDSIRIALFAFFISLSPPCSWLFVFSSCVASKGCLKRNYPIQMKGNIAFGRSNWSLSRTDSKLWIRWRFLSLLFFLFYFFLSFFPPPCVCS